MKRNLRLIALILMLALLLSPAPVLADEAIKVLSNSAVAEFPTRLVFFVSAEGTDDITDVRLHYRVDHLSFSDVTSEVYIGVTPSKKIETFWDWDMRRTGGLPPGTGIEYWWTLRDASGNQTTTAPARFTFDDSRYDWQTLSKGQVTLLWYDGDEVFGQKLMDAVQRAEDRMAGITGAELMIPARIYIYANTRDLQGSMIFPQEWTGGVTFTRYGIIAIGIAGDQLEWGARAIAHELTHLVVDQLTLNPYNQLPTWLNEGLAMYSEGELTPSYREILARAAAEGLLLSVRSLSSPFSAYGDISQLSYAQSYSIVESLISAYGQDKMFELLKLFKQGTEYDAALLKIYGFATDDLNVLWRNYLSTSTPVAAAASAAGETLPVPVEYLVAAGAGVFLAGAYFGFKLWKRNR
ncbi:MAG: peptidase MA domain-containing protein [Chloroflexi bacterium]|nr:peptidase MA domain-containing protein [Chloroflexota bacterium]